MLHMEGLKEKIEQMEITDMQRRFDTDVPKSHLQELNDQLKKQIEMLEIIVRRMCAELSENDAEVPLSDPLLWLLHGTPGTGKSEVTKSADLKWDLTINWLHCKP